MLNPKKYRSIKAQTVGEPKTRIALEDLAQMMEQLARDVESRIANIPTGDTFPAGAIVFWLGTAATIPAGWEEATELRERFPRGMASGGTPSATGGSTQHLHEVTGGTMGAPNSVVGVAGGSSYSVATGTHVHSYTDYTSNASNLPPYVDGIWIRKL